MKTYMYVSLELLLKVGQMHVQTLPQRVKAGNAKRILMLADVVAVIGTQDIVFGEIDR